MKKINNQEISLEGLLMLQSLRDAVKKELERKTRLGHYFVTWENGKIIFTGEDKPKTL